jgi:hypothetical protein
MSLKFFSEKSMGQDQKKSSFYIYIWTIIGTLLGTLWIVGYAWQSKDWTAFFATLGASCMLAGAFLITGVFLGFLFGFPHMLQGKPSGGNANPGQPEGGVPAVRHEVNTNLEQISDWLTKILVGVSLTQVGSMPGWLRKYTKFAAPGLGGYPNSEIFATGILIYYIVVGFLCGFLLTRLAIAGAIREADLEADLVNVAQKVADVESKISEEAAQKKTDEETLFVVQVQLNASRNAPLPPQEDLNAKIKAASPAARSQVYFLAREARSQNRETNKPKMERTIPIFRALIASEEKDKRDHNNHGQLGFALKDQEPPACKEAEGELSTAIEIRDAQQGTGAVDYEFVRAFCRIKLEQEALESGQPPSEETKRKILADLQKAAQDITLHKRMQEDETIKQWLENNQAWLQEKNVTLP